MCKYFRLDTIFNITFLDDRKANKSIKVLQFFSNYSVKFFVVGLCCISNGTDCGFDNNSNNKTTHEFEGIRKILLTVLNDEQL